MNTQISNAFAAGSGLTPGAMKVVILSICAALVLVFAIWLVSRLLEDYSSREIEAAEVMSGIAYIAVPLLLLLAVLAWL